MRLTPPPSSAGSMTTAVTRSNKMTKLSRVGLFAAQRSTTNDFEGLLSSKYIKISRSDSAVLLCWSQYVACCCLRFNAGGPPTTNIHHKFASSEFETCLSINDV